MNIKFEFIFEKTIKINMPYKKYQDGINKMKEYRKTPQGKKSNRISQWKFKGIIFHDYDILYDIYMNTTHCNKCKCELNKCERSRKCMDHDHSITDTNNVRNIICNSCNVKRG